jgi:flavin reductase (DIM6/NTAB) family NADH-FMN oxidoreductase RutF
MEQITISEAQKSTSPNPITLICAETPTGIINLTAVSWWTYLANHPPMIGFAISKKSFTGELILSSGKAVLSIPGEAIAEEAFQCGCLSGRHTNKAEKLGIVLTETAIKFPVHSKLAFVCTLESSVDVGDHTFFICKVDDIFYNKNEEQLYSWGGYSKLAPLNGSSSNKVH